jgi:hypothetical protein
MKYNFAMDTSPYEIGDKLRIGGKSVEITDISMTQYVRSGKTEFRYELDNNGNYIPIQTHKVSKEILDEEAVVIRYEYNSNVFFIRKECIFFVASVVNSEYPGGEALLGNFFDLSDAESCVIHYALEL